MRKRFAELELLTASVIDPNGAAMQRWDGIMCVLLVFTAIWTPFEVAFLHTKLDAVFWLNRAVDIGFAIDIWINVRLSYYDEVKGMWVLK